jgi:hypothetical protein
MRNSFVIACAVLLLPLAQALAQKAPPANQVSIDSVQVTGGDACRNAVAVVSPDAQAFTVGFLQFDAGVGQGPTISSKAKCHVHLKVSIPAGWQYALANVDYFGYVALDPGVTGSRQSTYHFSGEAPDKTAAYTWSPGVADFYQVFDVAASAPLYYSRCGKGKNIMIDTQISVDNSANPSGQGYLTVDVIDGEALHLVWQQCK